MSRYLWWIAEFLGFLLLNKIFAKPAAKLSAKLGENAVIGWIDDRIGEAVGMTAPTIQTVVEWGLPALLAIAVLLGLHWVQVRFFSQATTQTASVGHLSAKANGVSQIPQRLYAQARSVHSALGSRVTIAWILIIGCTAGLIVAITMLAMGPRKIAPMAAIPKDSMLSGRPVSGLEIASRLERLEKEHANTVSELATAKQQLQSKQEELAAVKSPPKSAKAAAPAPDLSKGIAATHIDLGPVASENKAILVASRYYSGKNKEEVADRIDRITETMNRADKEMLLPVIDVLSQRFLDRPVSEASKELDHRFHEACSIVRGFI